MKITRTSPFTGQERTIDLPVTQAQLDAWKAGKLAQDAFPELNADQREFIMTGIVSWEWDHALRLAEVSCEENNCKCSDDVGHS